MARQYGSQKRGQMVTIHGFSEMAEMLQQLEKRGVDEITTKLFDESCEIVKTAMDTYAAQSIPAELAAKQKQYKVRRGNVFQYAYGFDRNSDPEDFLKACYLNYGTPHRSTEKGAYRGKVQARGFISNAKRSAAQKMNARKKAMMKELMQRSGLK